MLSDASSVASIIVPSFFLFVKKSLCWRVGTFLVKRVEFEKKNYLLMQRRALDQA
jgi:hypothetical protein